MIPVNATGHGYRAAGPAGAGALRGLLTLLAVYLATLLPTTVRADCLELPFADTRSLEAISIQDPKRALEVLSRALASEEGAIPEDRRHVAALHAVQAASYSLLELDTDARAAAAAGLELAPEPTDPIHVALQISQAENIYDSQGIDGAIADIEKARSLQSRGSRADVCLQVTLGRLQYRRDRVDLALQTLTQAYRASIALGLEGPRVLAAAALSPVMRVEGDFNQALALSQEVIDWQLRHQATMSLSVARYLRGQILIEMREYKRALDETEEARKLSVELNDEQGVGFSDLAICEARLELGQLTLAREGCENALRIFSASRSLDVIKQSQTLLARIDLAEDHAAKALATLNEVLTGDGADVQPRLLPGVYQLRAEANAALHKYAEAYRDLNEYLKRNTTAVDAERTKQVAALRARFETDREIARNEMLQRELELARERAERQRIQLRWVIMAIIGSGLVIALLTYLLVENLRYRKQLVLLASLDSLTGLPNRGRTATVATQALEAALAAQKPLCLGLLDLDRFKMLNDQLGHATGDRVLKEFAQIASASIRGTDTLGRWGGEEFLLILPNTTLDTAVQIVERIRQRVGLIHVEAMRVSISAGLATNGGDDLSLDEILARADVALYKAKNSGRDLVYYAEESFDAASSGVRRALSR
jgi:diguanylate cyclase (GGDEF)-like protein